MSKIQIDKIAPNKSDHVSVEGDLLVTGKINGISYNILGAVTPMFYATTWQKSAFDFEFAFNTFKWSNIGNPFIGPKPFSTDINPKTGNAYDFDFQNNLFQITAGCKIAWMDEDSSKWFDWNYTYVDPITLQDQTWEPKGLILTNATASSWNSTTSYTVGQRVSYNNFVWKCVVANTNQTPATTIPLFPPAFDYWQNTGIPVGTGALGSSSVPNVYSNFYQFNAMASLSEPNSQWIFAGGGPGGGTSDGIYLAWLYSSRFSPAIEGKMPIVTLNVALNSTNSNRYPSGSPFSVQHQMNMLNYINTGMGLSPNTLPKVDTIVLGSNMYNKAGSTSGQLCEPNPIWFFGFNGYSYGSAMTQYVSQIRANSDSTTANAKIHMQGVSKTQLATNSIPSTRWIYDNLNPLDINQGFIHGFYNPTNNPSGVDFDIISLQTNFGFEQITNFISSINGSLIPWSYQMGAAQYVNMKDTIADCKTALQVYGKQNRIKYWYRYLSKSYGTPPVGYTLAQANYSWATQTGVFMAMVLVATDPDFTGLQYNNILDYNNCSINIYYNSTDTFGSNTTDVFDLTSVGWMFKYFLNYFKPAYGAISYTRILKSGSLGQYGLNISDYCMGIYINSTGLNGTPKHRIILCNYSSQGNQSINIDSSQLIDPTWTNVQFMKVYTPFSMYDPINFYSAGNYITAQEIAPYTPTPAQILSTPLLPTEYLMITAD